MTALNVIRGIVSLTYILVISPYMIGSLLCYKLEGELMDSCAMRYVVGFFSQLGIWGILAMPVVVFMKDRFPAHILFLIFLCVLFFFFACFISVQKSRTVTIRERVNTLKRIAKSYYDESIVCRLLIIMLLAVTVFHLFMVIYGGWNGYGYDDDMLYIPEILSGLKADLIIVPNAKRELAPWLYYMNMLSYISGQHPIFICRVAVASVEYFLFLFVTLLFLKYIFEYDKRKIIYSLSCLMICIFTLGHSVANEYGMSTNPIIWWGKIILYTTMIPLLYILYYISTAQIAKTPALKIRYLLLLVGVGAGGTWLTLMSAISIPIGVGIITVYDYLLNKRKEGLLCGASLCCAGICQLILYFVMIISKYDF